MKQKRKKKYKLIGIRKANGDALVGELESENENAFIVSNPRYNGSKVIEYGTYYVDKEDVVVHFTRRS